MACSSLLSNWPPLYNAPTVITTWSPDYLNIYMGQVQIRSCLVSASQSQRTSLLCFPCPLPLSSWPPPNPPAFNSIRPPWALSKLPSGHQHCNAPPHLANYQIPVFAEPYLQCHASNPRQACSFIKDLKLVSKRVFPLTQHSQNTEFNLLSPAGLEDFHFFSPKNSSW